MIRGSTMCVFSDYEEKAQIVKEAILEWEYKLIQYTDSPHWILNKVVNPDGPDNCGVIINVESHPEKFCKKNCGNRLVSLGNWKVDRIPIITVYHTEYYNHVYKTEKIAGKDYPVRPLAYRDIDDSMLKQVTQHELGHIFGLKHVYAKDIPTSIMVTGHPSNYKESIVITKSDLENVVELYGSDGWKEKPGNTVLYEIIEKQLQKKIESGKIKIVKVSWHRSWDNATDYFISPKFEP